MNMPLLDREAVFRERAEYMLKRASDAPTADARAVFMAMFQGYGQMALHTHSSPTETATVHVFQL